MRVGFLAVWDSRFGWSVIPSSARFAVGGDRLGLSGGTLQLGVSGGTRAAAVADAAGGRAVHSQAYAQPLRRGAVRAMGGEPVFPVLLWGSGVPARAAI